MAMSASCFFFQAEDGIRDLVRSRGLGDVYKRQDQYGQGHETLLQWCVGHENRSLSSGAWSPLLGVSLLDFKHPPDDRFFPDAPQIAHQCWPASCVRSKVGHFSIDKAGENRDIGNAEVSAQQIVPLADQLLQIVAVSYTHLTLPTSDLV